MCYYYFAQGRENGLWQQINDQLRAAVREKRATSVGLVANAADVYPEILRRGIVPALVLALASPALLPQQSVCIRTSSMGPPLVHLWCLA